MYKGHLILTDMKLEGVMKVQLDISKSRRRVWRLKDENVQRNFQEILVLEEDEKYDDVNKTWQREKEGPLKTANEGRC